MRHWLEDLSMDRLDGKVAIVTGSSSGIGEATARRLADLGARVVVNSSSSVAAGKAVAASLPTESLYLQADISDQSQGHDLILRTVDRFGSLDILVNLSSIYEEAALSNAKAASRSCPPSMT